MLPINNNQRKISNSPLTKLAFLCINNGSVTGHMFLSIILFYLFYWTFEGYESRN